MVDLIPFKTHPIRQDSYSRTSPVAAVVSWIYHLVWMRFRLFDKKQHIHTQTLIASLTYNEISLFLACSWCMRLSGTVTDTNDDIGHVRACIKGFVVWRVDFYHVVLLHFS